MEAARCKSKETMVGIKVVYGTYKHFRSVRYEKWSYYGYFIAVRPLQTATFLGIAVSRDFCVVWISEAAARCKSKETIVGIKVVYGTNKHFRRVRYEKWSYCVYFIAVKPLQTATFLDMAVSRDFCVFWISEAARCKSKETIVGIKVVYGTNRHFRRVRYEKWSYYGYFIAVKPFQTATFLDIAVSRDFYVFWIFEAARCKSEETMVGIKVVYGTYKHFRSVRYEKWSYYGYL